jgi:hypothetical protein
MVFYASEEKIKRVTTSKNTAGAATTAGAVVISAAQGMTHERCHGVNDYVVWAAADDANRCVCSCVCVCSVISDVYICICT